MAATNINERKRRAKSYVTIIHSIINVARISAGETEVAFDFNVEWDKKDPLKITDGDKTYYVASFSTDMTGYKLYVIEAYDEDGKLYELEERVEIKYEDVENLTNAYNIVTALKECIY